MGSRIGSTGQSLVEYGLIVSLMVLVALVLLSLFDEQIGDILAAIAQRIN